MTFPTLLLAAVTESCVLGVPRAPMVSVSDLFEGRHDYERVSVVGTIQDVLRDETDPNYEFLAVVSDGETIYAALRPDKAVPFDPVKYLGARARIEGMVLLPKTNRKLMGHELSVTNTNDITILTPPPTDPFDVPELPQEFQAGPARLAALGRRRTDGQVLACWNRNHLLLKGRNGHVFSAELSGNDRPSCGAFVTVAGIPVTDIHRINLARAIWRPTAAWNVSAEEPLDITAAEILYDKAGNKHIRPALHGRLIRLKGILRGLPRPGTQEDCLYLDCDSHPVTVHATGIAGSLADLAVGSSVEITGICLLELPNWQPNMAFPRHEGFVLCLRTPTDIRVLARPPWWTPGRLLGIIIALFVSLAGILTWNRALRHLAERRGRELLREQIVGVRAELKYEEHTRLATELHDSLSQTLTGVALELNIADSLKGDAPPAMLTHLARAEHALKSCRNELRNCLWDLRGQALEEKDMTKAILRALQPYVVGDPRLNVRFNVPRTKLSDNTAHAILCIVRELVLNALNHGLAQQVQVAGCLENGNVCFSVRDNGCGFDPDNRPDETQGHYGLLGVRDRIRRAGGTLEIVSVPGQGAAVTVHLPAHAEIEK